MTKFVIEGGNPIAGTIKPIGNKNAMLPLLSACLLTEQPVVLHNLPQIGDTFTMCTILEGLGVEIEHFGNDAEGYGVRLNAKNVHSTKPDAALFSQIRGSLTMMGPLLARFGHFGVGSSAGGDDIGRRRIDTHLQVFRELGGELSKNGQFELKASGRLQAKDILLDEASVTATENGIMAAALAKASMVPSSSALP